MKRQVTEVPPEQVEEHEISAYYALGKFGMVHSPSLACSCGFIAWEETWEDAGALMDGHIDSVREGR